MNRRRTILLVDTDANVLALLQAALRLKGYRVVSRKDPVEALSYLKTTVPDLVICDTELSHIDGFEFIRRVQGSTRAAYAPFIFIGEETEPEKVAAGLRMGAREFLRKPFTVDELLVRVGKVFTAVDSARTATPRHDLEGNLGMFSFVDLLELLRQRCATGKLTLNLPFEPVEGIVLLEEGEPVHAVFGRLKGRAAILQLMLGDEGVFCYSAEPPPRPSVVTVSKPGAEIVEDGEKLKDAGLLRRVDVVNRAACLTFVRLVEPREGEEAILLTDRIAPVIVIEESETTDESFSHDEVSDTVRGGLADEADRHASRSDDDSAESASLDHWSSESLVLEAEEFQATDSVVLVPANSMFAADERLSISGEVGLSPADEGAVQSIIVPALGDSSDEFSNPPSGETPSVVGVALVDGGPGPLELTYNALRVRFREEQSLLGVRDFQISTRSGRCLASTVASQSRREMIAAFTAQATQFASQSEDGIFVQLAAGDLQILVMELPRRRLLTSLFDQPPDVESFRRVVQAASQVED